jgi:hypothetical protein
VVPHVFQLEGGLLLVVSLVLLALKIYALVTALMFSPDHYRAADKLTKPAWVAILGIGVAAQVLMPDVRNLINLAFTIAVFVYLADVRPALRGLRQRR